MLDNKSVPSRFESLYPASSRFEEIERMLSFIKEGNACQLIGLPGAGNITTLRLLQYNKAVREKHLGEHQKWFHFVAINLSEVRGKPMVEVTKHIFLSLLASLAERGMVDMHEKAFALFKKGLSLDDDSVLFAEIKNVIDMLAIEKELTVVFLFERFEQSLPLLTEDLFARLLSIRNRASYRFSVVFSLHRPLEQIIDITSMGDFYSFLAGRTVFMRVKDEESLDFTISYLEKTMGKTLPKGAKEQIITLTSGHGNLTKAAVEEVLRNPKTSDYETLLTESRSVRSVLYEIWNAFRPEEQEILKQVTKDPKTSAPASQWLSDVGIIDQGRISIPLLNTFVKYRAQQKVIEPLSFDEQTKTIRKGEREITQEFTKSEYRLLTLLLEHKGQIVDRESIVSRVWSDLPSKEGITDQAIDQLVFRLRRKIEEDPNAPTHLLTIKGRGILLSS